MFWILLTILVVVVGFLFYRSRLKPQLKRRPKLAVDNKVTFPIKDFRGNAIVVGEGACEGVRQYDGKRFLVHETPRLPLESCKAPHCNCRYVHLEDRRSREGDRRNNYGMATQYYEHIGYKEKRFKKERRQAH